MGLIYKNGTVIGCVNGDGVVFAGHKGGEGANCYGDVEVGLVDADGRVFAGSRDADNQVGHVDGYGKVFDSSGEVIGKVKSDGTVLEDNTELATVDGPNRNSTGAAALLLFNLHSSTSNASAVGALVLLAIIAFFFLYPFWLYGILAWLGIAGSVGMGLAYLSIPDEALTDKERDRETYLKWASICQFFGVWVTSWAFLFLTDGETYTAESTDWLSMSGILGWEFIGESSRSEAIDVAFMCTVVMLGGPHLVAWQTVQEQQKNEGRGPTENTQTNAEYKRLLSMKKAELVQLAGESDIEVPSAATKAQIIELLGVCEGPPPALGRKSAIWGLASFMCIYVGALISLYYARKTFKTAGASRQGAWFGIVASVASTIMYGSLMFGEDTSREGLEKACMQQVKESVPIGPKRMAHFERCRQGVPFEPNFSATPTPAPAE